MPVEDLLPLTTGQERAIQDFAEEEAMTEPLTREEILLELKGLLSELSLVHPSRYALSGAIAALSSSCAICGDRQVLVCSNCGERKPCACSPPCACGGREPLHVVRTIAWRTDSGRLYVVADTPRVYFGEAGSKSTSDELVNVTAIVLEGWHPPLTSDELAYVSAGMLGIFHRPDALPAEDEPCS